MDKINLNRRDFLIGAAKSTVFSLAALNFPKVLFAADSAVSDDKGTFVFLFLRGGFDGLNFIGPAGDSDYYNLRRNGTGVLDSGDNAGLILNGNLNNTQFLMNAKASPFKELFDAGHLALIPAAGLINGTRSHFEAQDMIDHGVADQTYATIDSGWLTRYLLQNSIENSSPAITTSAALPENLYGSQHAISVGDPTQFKYNGPKDMEAVIRSLYQTAPTMLKDSAYQTTQAIDGIQSSIPNDFNMKYLKDLQKNSRNDNLELYNSLSAVSLLLKLNLGVNVAAVDFGGWDTHQAQAPRFNRLIDDLSRSVSLFFNDVTAMNKKVTVVMMSEFGRRLKSNQSQGTDHGHGNVMMVLGNNIKGGQFYGKWPGLQNEVLDNGVDLAVTTDYRQVLSDLLLARQSNADLKTIFPGFKSGGNLGFI